MRITLFTSNNIRHNYLINLLVKNCKELNVIQEVNTLFHGKNIGSYDKNKKIYEYFKKVNLAQKHFFGNKLIFFNRKLNFLPIMMGDINNIDISEIKKIFLSSDLYIVFGSSFIKGDLFNFLKKKRCLNIHMGVSPYYRGADCNFWSLFDNNSHLTGATIHLLSEKLDSGSILYHAMSNYINKGPFIYSMSCVASAFNSIIYNIKNKDLFTFKPINQNLEKQIRYSKKKDFTSKIVQQFQKKKIILNKKKNDQLLIRPYYFN